MAEEKRKGRQTPTTSVVLPYKKTYGGEALNLYRESGRKPRPWQKALINDILAVDKKKQFVHALYGYQIPRRNGKGEVLAIRELWGLMNGERILHTAHRVSTSTSAFERLCDILTKAGIMHVPFRSTGLENIKSDAFPGSIYFRTRSTKSGLGLGYDLLVIDEAQEYTDGEDAALKYVVSDSSRPQIIFCGTPPTAYSAGTVFQKMRDNTLAGKSVDTGWAEWSVEKMTDPHDRDAWYETNPSLGYQLTEQKIQREIRGDDIDFNIQRLGLWLKYNQKSAISETLWNGLKCEKEPTLTGQMHVGIKYSKDGKTAAMSIAVKTADGKIFIEAIDDRPIHGGNKWILDFLSSAKPRAVVIDGAIGKEALPKEMAELRLDKPVLPRVDDVIAAGARFEEGLYQGTICHNAQFSLAQSATNCDRRAIGTAGGFGYKSLNEEIDVSLLESAVLAHWSAATEKPKPKQRISY